MSQEKVQSGAVEGGEAGDRRTKILAAAIRVFARKGYYGCRMADVAEEAQVAYGLVYHYFQSKEQLLKVVFAETFDAFVHQIEEIARGTSTAAEKVDRVIGTAMELLRTEPDVIRLIILQVSRTQSIQDPDLYAHFLRFTNILAEMVMEGQRRGELNPDLEPLSAAQCLIGSLESTLTSYLMAEQSKLALPSLERCRHTLVQIFLRGTQLPRG